MVIAKDAVFSLTSVADDKKALGGTGAAIAYRDDKLYLLTCAHVLEQLESKVKVNEEVAEVVAQGSGDGIDLALLCLPWKQSPPSLLNQVARGEPGHKFEILGYSPFRNRENFVQRTIKGQLGKNIDIESKTRRIEAWDLHIDDDALSKLKEGYSGSPLCDENGRLLAVVSHRADSAGQFGHAIALSNLKTIYPKIDQLIPAFSTLEVTASFSDRIMQTKKQFRSLLLEYDLADNLLDLARSEFKRMEDQGPLPEDTEFFQHIAAAFAKPVAIKDFIHFLEQLDKKRRNTVIGPNYTRLARQLAQGEVILCLGQEILQLLGASVLSTAEIKKWLHQEDFHGPLSELCEQKLITPENSRTDLVNELREILELEHPEISVTLYKMLARLQQPFIVISTAYDDLLQQSLRQEGKKFVEIYPHIEEGKCLLLYSDSLDRQGILCTPQDISAQEPLERGYIVICRLRGGIVGGTEKLLLAERDYFACNKIMEKQFPDYIGSRMKNTLSSLWFLGHHPQSWEERLLVRFLKDMQVTDTFALAVQEQPSTFNRNFWQYNKVKIFDISLADFVEKLQAAL